MAGNSGGVESSSPLLKGNSTVNNMITIHKYQFELGREIVIEMPEMAKIIDVQMQNEIPTMWAIVDTGLPIVKRKFEAVWTGEELKGAWFHRTHIATVQDIYVWHIFE